MTRGTLRAGAVVAALASLGMAAGAAGDLLAGWNFNGLTTPVTSSVSAQHGFGTLDLAEFAGSGLAWQAGSDLNLWPGDAAGDGLGFSTTSPNGKSATFALSTVGHHSISLSMAVRATSSGHLGSVIEAWDGAGWDLVGGFSLTAGVWSVSSFNLSSLTYLDDGTATLRLRLLGATSGAGNFRIDNVRVEGTPVPAPGVWALLGTALLVGRRRR